jgi:hypothetical protein
MGSKTNLSWVNDSMLYGGNNLGDTTVTASNPFASKSIGFDNIQGPNIPTSMPSNTAPLKDNVASGINNSTSTVQKNPLTGNQIAGIVGGGSQMLNSWFQNMDKPIEAPTTSDQIINGYDYTKINSINQHNNSEGAFGATTSGAASGASVGAAFGPLGVGIGAGVGAIGGFVSNLFGNKSRNNKIRTMNAQNYGQTEANRSQAETNYLKQQYTQNSTFADGGMYLSTMITDMMAKMRNNNINNHNLNNFFTGGMFMGTQLDPETLTGRLSRNKYADGGEYNPGMTGMMKAKMALAAEFGNKSAKRMTAVNPKTYTFTGTEGVDVPAGEKGTHFMGSYDNIARPSIQEINGKLQYTGFPSTRSNEDIVFDRPEDAEYFAEHYKEIAPMMKNWDKYSNGGLVRYIPIEQKDTDNSYNEPQLAKANAFNTPNAWVNKKETIMSQNGNVDSVDNNNPNMVKVHSGEDGYLASLQDGDMILSNNIKIPGTNKTFAQKGKNLEALINKAKEPTYNNVSDNTNKLNAQNAMNEYKQLFELQQQLKFKKK